MLILQAIILGILQGLTEFLPVSSSGHLIIMQSFFPELAESPVVLDVILHMGTLLALLIYFWKEIIDILKKPKNIINVVIATLVTGIIVFPFKDYIKSLFSSPKFAVSMLLVTGLILFIASKIKNNKQNKVKVSNAILIGIAQAFAVIPGISRSGSTISMGLFSGLKSSVIAEFSFIIAMPIIFGAGVLELRHIDTVNTSLVFPYIFGFIASFVAGLITIKWFISLLKNNANMLKYFSYYLFTVGVLGLFYF